MSRSRPLRSGGTPALAVQVAAAALCLSCSAPHSQAPSPPEPEAAPASPGAKTASDPAGNTASTPPDPTHDLCGPFAGAQGAGLSVADSALGKLLTEPAVRVHCESTPPGAAPGPSTLRLDYRGLARSPEREVATWARKFGDCGEGEYVTRCRGNGCWDLAIEAAGSHGNGYVVIRATDNGRCASGTPAPSGNPSPAPARSGHP